MTKKYDVYWKPNKSSDDGEEATPVPIPNTEVKLFSADGSWGSPPVRVGRRQACYIYIVAGWSSSVARRAHNPKVTGSNPVPAIVYGPVVQLVRMPACHAGGRGFESRPDRHFLFTAQ